MLMYMMMAIIKSTERCQNCFHQCDIGHEIYTRQVNPRDLRVRFVGRAFRHANFPIFLFFLIHSLTGVPREVNASGTNRLSCMDFQLCQRQGILLEEKKIKKKMKRYQTCVRITSSPFGYEMKEVEMKRIECMFGIVLNVWT